MVGGVVDLKRVLIPRPGRVRRLRHGYTRVLPVRQPAPATDDPAARVSIEPHDRVAPVLVTSTVRLVRPESLAADWTGNDVAGLIVNGHRCVDHLHIVIETPTSAVVGGEAGH